MRPVPRSSLTLASLFAIGCLSVFAYTSCATRPVDAPSGTQVATSASIPPPVRTASVDAESPLPASEPSAPLSVPGDPIDKALVDATGDDSRARSDAIAALASAPKVRALPVLQNVLTGGSSDDRRLAMKTLRTLAQQQGDADGGVRNVLRHGIYHGDDEAIVRESQAALDDVEHDLTRQTTGPKSPR